MIDKSELSRARKIGRITGSGCALIGAFGLYLLVFTSQHPLHIVIIGVGSAASLYGVWLFLIYGEKLLSEVESEISERNKRKGEWIVKTAGPETSKKGATK